MALTTADVIFYGPCTFTAGGISYSNINVEAVSLSVESSTGSIDLEDGSSMSYVTGRKLTAECTVSEINTADIDAIDKSTTDITLVFSEPSKTITVTAPELVVVGIDNGKTKITVTKSGHSGTDVSELFTVS